MTTTTKSKKQASTKATASNTAPDITENPDGTFDLHGEVAKRAIEGAAFRGITLNEFAEIAIRHGMALMVERPRFESAICDDKLPIYLPAETVRFLTEVCEAGGITVDEFANGVLGDIVSGSLAGMGDAESLVLDSWQHKDREADEIAMKAVVERWMAKDAVPV